MLFAAVGFSTAEDDKATKQEKSKKTTAAEPTKSADAKKPATTAPKATAAAQQVKPPAKTDDAEPQKPTAPAAVKSAPPAKSSAAAAAFVKQVRAAKGSLIAADSKQVASSRNDAAAAVQKLAARFNAMSQPNGTEWKKYARVDELQSELKKTSDVDVAVLEDVQGRLTAGYEGLENEPYRETAAALGRYAAVVGAAQNNDLKKDYEKRLDDLADAIEAVGDGTPDAAQAATIGNHVAWLNRHGQAPQLVAEISKRYSQPNLLVDVQETFVAETIAGNVDQEEPVRDFILGTSISGSGRTVGKLSLDFVDSPNQGVIDAFFQGTNYSETVGHNRSAVIYSTGRTELSGQKTLHVTDAGIQAVSGTTKAVVHNKITGIGSTKSGCIGKIVIKVASKKAPQKQGQAQAVASRHAEARLLRKLNEQSAEFVEKANDDYHRRLRLPLTRFDAVPRVVRVSTTDDMLQVRVLQDAAGRLAAPGVAPPSTGSGAAVRVHHSLVDNTTQQMLAGRRFDRARLIDLAQNQLGLEVPENDDDTPFAITFADEDPVTLGLEDGVVSVTVRGKQFMSDEKLYEGMYITARYKAATAGDGLRLTREGDLIIAPPGFRSGVDKLSLSQTALKRLLQRRFDKMLPVEVVGEGVELEGDLGTLVVSQLQIDNGWAVLGWKRKPATVGAE